MIGFLKYMPDLDYSNDVLRFTDDKSVVAGNDVIDVKRDPVLYRIYRKKLYTESESVYSQIICYACKLPWKGLVTSHIKPLAVCLKEKKPTEAYDKDNGLLLSPNIDAYFDKFDISFDEHGVIMISDSIADEIADTLKDYSLDEPIMTPTRMEYLKYHRKAFEDKNRRISA